jgi:hypothetical protein
MIGKKQINKKGGIALLMAVLVSSLFFVIGAAIFKIAFIELVLSAAGKESQFAFYSADSGAECALYWDRNYLEDPNAGGCGGNGSCSAFSIFDNGGSNRDALIPDYSSIKCGGAAVSTFCNGEKLVNGACSGGFAGDTMIKIDQSANNICAEVSIRKGTALPVAANPANSGAEAAVTEIVSRGYNTCNANSPRRVERAIKITIQ